MYLAFKQPICFSLLDNTNDTHMFFLAIYQIGSLWVTIESGYVCIKVCTMYRIVASSNTRY